MLISILLISLFTISASFALSDNLTVNETNFDDSNINKRSIVHFDDLVEGKDYIVEDDGSVCIINGEINPGDFIGTYVNKSNDNNTTKFIFNGGKLYEDYLGGFNGFVSKLSDAKFYGMSNYKPFLYAEPLDFDLSKNLTDYNAISFVYGGEKYLIYTGDIVDVNKSKAIPVYISDNSIHVGHPKENEQVVFTGYAVLNNLFWKGSAADVELLLQKSNNTTDLDNQNGNNSLMFYDDSNVNLENSSNVNSSSKNIDSQLKTLENTGIPIAILVTALLLAIVGFRRKY